MPFPLIRHCLICEEVRIEGQGKSSILGFYGIAPSVNLAIKDLTKPLERLSFLLMCDSGDGDYKLSVMIDDPKGVSILTTPEADFSFPRSTQPLNLILAIGAISFPIAGRYRFVLTVQGDEKFETFFDIREESPSQSPR